LLVIILGVRDGDYFMNKYKHKTQKRYWTSSEMQFLRDNYVTLGMFTCAKHLSRSKSSVRGKSHNLGIKMPRKKINMSLFYKIDSDVVAYFLGYMWADGHLSNISASLQIISKDAHCFFSSLNFIGEFGTYERTPKNSNNMQSCITIYDKEFRNFLEQNDFKSKSLLSPTKILSLIPAHLRKYFWLGFFDGDGCVTKTHKSYRYPRVIFSGSFEQDWSELNQLLTKLKATSTHSKTISKKGHKYSTITISGIHNCKNILDFLYSGANSKIGLKRKKDRYLEILSVIS
jgi:hypothetical protein